MAIQLIDLAAQQARLRPEIDAAIARVLDHGAYIMGPEVAELERQLAAFCGVKYALACANGTDALLLALMALGVRPNDAVFCPSFTFAATAEVIPLLGATPVFADADPRTFNLDVNSLERAIAAAKALGLRPAGVIPVDLFGLPADYDALAPVCARHGLWMLCDTAQAFGAKYHGRATGAIGDIATTSFFPAKPLGCYGDGGAVFTNNGSMAALIESFRVHGKGEHKYDNVNIGMNSRLDTLQAAILLQKLKVYPGEIASREAVAQHYQQALANVVETPFIPAGLQSVWAQYTIKLASGGERQRVQAALAQAGIPCAIYYPRPLHRQTAYRNFPADPNGLPVSDDLAGRVLSLPMHPYLGASDQARIIAALRGCL